MHDTFSSHLSESIRSLIQHRPRRHDVYPVPDQVPDTPNIYCRHAIGCDPSMSGVVFQSFRLRPSTKSTTLSKLATSLNLVTNPELVGMPCVVRPTYCSAIGASKITTPTMQG